MFVYVVGKITRTSILDFKVLIIFLLGVLETLVAWIEIEVIREEALHAKIAARVVEHNVTYLDQ